MSHPAPLVTARPAEADEIPRTARLLMTKATAAGWAASASYARGTALSGRAQNVGKVVDSVVVRLELKAGGARAVAVWVDGKFDNAFRWAHWLELEELGARSLTAWLLAVSDMVTDIIDGEVMSA